MTQLFGKECLNLIASNFEHLFNFDRRNLLLVLSLMAAENGRSLWNEVISKRYGLS